MTLGHFGQRARAVKHDVHALYHMARDPRVPGYVKAAALIAAVYAVSPLIWIAAAVLLLWLFWPEAAATPERS